MLRIGNVNKMPYLLSFVRSDRQYPAAVRSPNACPPNSLCETAVVQREQVPYPHVGVDPRGASATINAEKSGKIRT